MNTLVDDISAAGIEIAHNVSGSTLTTYRVGGDVHHVVTLHSRTDIDTLTNVLSSHADVLNADNTITIGKGSNLIVADSGFDGCVFVLGDELATWDGQFVEHGDDLEIDVPAGVGLPAFARQCAPLGISGLEFYVGIPGSIGGAVAMNAGGHGQQTSDVLISAESLNLTNGTSQTRTINQCDFSYRHSCFVSTDLVFSARLLAHAGDADDIKEKIDSIVSWRRENQPGGRNVGSVFQNPEDVSAGSLIEKCELKGIRIGGAHVSEKHANFIQADDNATAADVMSLISHVQSVVADSTGYQLETEVRYIGNYANG